MEKHFKRLPSELLEIIRLAADIANTRGFRAYLVGGFVRDLILGVKNLDVDIAVEGEAIPCAEALAERLNAHLLCHRRFGTATVSVHGRAKIDLASTRKEFYPEPGSLPVVNSGTLRDDLARRDFTINTLAISVNPDDFGRLIDVFDARKDIAAQKVRILHPLSFIDDPTRILRAVRFEQRYGFCLEPHTRACLFEAVRLKMLQAVEPQRLRDEIILLLKESEPGKVLRRLDSLAGLDFIHAGLCFDAGAARLFRRAAAQVRWFTRSMHQHRRLDTWLIFFLCLLDQLGAHASGEVCRRFVLRKGEEKRVKDFFRVREKALCVLRRPGILPSTVFDQLKPHSYEVIIMLAAKAQDSVAQRHIRAFLCRYNATDITVCGHDLRSLGLAPGPHYQTILRAVLKAKLNGTVSTVEDELALAKRLHRRHDQRSSAT